ncbi:hypothetical protein EalM132_00164 [Exiguobacterium phage vB_EalM-132]|nr:hypothetical protein EalM132_00164 [Exiguobacterium phage vB_EalM-132]
MKVSIECRCGKTGTIEGEPYHSKNDISREYHYDAHTSHKDNFEISAYDDGNAYIQCRSCKRIMEVR